jgi:pimeloyl-ACP methyl ester carboxylesterase
MPIASGLYYSLNQGIDLEIPPVVLIHGAGGNHLHWPSEIRRLAGQRVFALDLPGHGRSEGRGQQSIQAYAASVLEWLQSLNLARAIFVGHSMGAAVALTLALEKPETVLGLGLLGAGARLPFPAEILADTVSATTFHKAVDALIALAFSPAADPRLVELASSRMCEVRPGVFHGDLLACAAFDVTRQLEQIDRPALILCGVEDRLTPPRFSQLLAGLIPNARVEFIAEAGHMVMLEQPQAVAARLVPFLESIPYIAG